MTAVHLSEVSAGYRGRTVVSGVTLDVPTGAWLAIIGPNGAGKSTLLKAIAGLVPQATDVRVDDRPTRTLDPRERARLIGYAPQNPVMPDGLSVTDYVLLGRTPHLGLLAREGPRDLAIVHSVLDRLDLAELADRPLRTLSGGERQRTVLARVLAQQAGVLLLDEPTTGLDIGHAQSLLELVDRLRAEDGTTVISTLHDLTFAAQYCDRLVLLNAGTVVASGKPAEVLTPELLTEHYGATVEVLPTREGNLVVAPTRARPEH
ncbi:iron complex transport system ATP-binding protein [Herbihabitans rhizosphaerae]|uniref:Iron complex transport system ATP-binding protein n=1 Tax=Herbihabitans rhizosphaerae TaxID=1872711 RepID=A0A4V2ERW5_9PSEU|nr:ABC transporter ATP-binding protein [Herbihabitans rhizosphaerae]RZS34287.1 iron complex transport system ATP-binding protein [Herbihabitans rhizosphaerae]